LFDQNVVKDDQRHLQEGGEGRLASEKTVRFQAGLVQGKKNIQQKEKKEKKKGGGKRGKVNSKTREREAPTPRLAKPEREKHRRIFERDYQMGGDKKGGVNSRKKK